MWMMYRRTATTWRMHWKLRHRRNSPPDWRIPTKCVGSHAILCSNSDGAQQLLSKSEEVGNLGILWTSKQDILSLRISLN